MGENENNEQKQSQETVSPTSATAPSSAELDELRTQLDAKEKQLKEYLDRLRRSQADFENYKKRIQKEQEQFLLIMEDRLISEFLPLYDNLERAFRSYNHNKDKESFIEGIERIFAQFHSFMETRGVHLINALGEIFDPAKHEALITVETTESGGKVLEEFERGFTREGRVIRPSKVKVSKKIEKKITIATDASPTGTPEGSPKEG
ncbi:nucleotide exchange factor GrpE [Candidatus Acetothermia bacterium]|nr:nucleotide exchange factor GrpE [Candidatus Acetothermia bacterium]